MTSSDHPDEPPRTEADVVAPVVPRERELEPHALRREAVVDRAFSRLATLSLLADVA